MSERRPTDPVPLAQNDVHARLDAVVDRLRPRLETFARDVHAHPELAFAEHRTVARLTDWLRAEGFAVACPYGGLDTSFEAVLELNDDGPEIVLLAEYDALPELGHACGHNLICTAAIGAATALREVLPKLDAPPPGRLRVVGTPAEEGGAGKILLLEQGAFDRTDAALMFHPSHRTMPVRGALALCRLTFAFHGVASHASTNPHLGVNALDACIQTFNAVAALRQHLPDEHRVHGVITHGGTAANVVPEYAEAQFLVRHKRLETVFEIRDRVIRAAQHAAASVGATVEVEEGHAYAERNNNVVIGTRFGRHLKRQGVELQEPPQVGGVGSSDFGNLSQAVPAIHAYVKIAPEGTSNHTHAFAAAAASDAGMAGMLQAAKALAATAADLFLDPALLAAARREFADGRHGGAG